MKTRAVLIAAAILASQAAHAQGTPEQRAACTPDVRKFCHAIPESAGTGAFLNCLQTNRAKLSDKCRRVIDGQ